MLTSIDAIVSGIVDVVTSFVTCSSAVSLADVTSFVAVVSGIIADVTSLVAVVSGIIADVTSFVAMVSGIIADVTNFLDAVSGIITCSQLGSCQCRLWCALLHPELSFQAATVKNIHQLCHLLSEWRIHTTKREVSEE